MEKIIKNTLGKLLRLLVYGVILCFIIFLAFEVYITLQEYNERKESQSDYTRITTPLPRNVVDDICSKFEIQTSDTRCQPGSVVYGPDFFKDIKSYFRDLPSEKATFETVQDKLGNYSIMCEAPDNDGYYRCRYDLRKDGIYPIFVSFTDGNYIYLVIANTSGS